MAPQGFGAATVAGGDVVAAVVLGAAGFAVVDPEAVDATAAVVNSAGALDAVDAADAAVDDGALADDGFVAPLVVVKVVVAGETDAVDATVGAAESLVVDFWAGQAVHVTATMIVSAKTRAVRIPAPYSSRE